MSRIIVIGGSGHVGSYLIPRLIARGHVVLNVSRGRATPYRPHLAWNEVENVIIDRAAEEANGRFGNRVADLEPEIVVDMISFDLASTQQLVEALRDKIEHFLFCSSIWVYGRLVSVPSTEEDSPTPIDSYGRKKAEIESWLLQEARRNGLPATCFRPGHIVGEGWMPINPVGNLNPAVFSLIASGDELLLPNLGLETLHHVHADDVAHWIVQAIDHRAASIGEVFNTVSAQAINLRGYAEAVYRWFGKEPRLGYKPFEEWILAFKGYDAELSRAHIIRSSCHSIAKSRERIAYSPGYSSLEAIHESVRALVANGQLSSTEREAPLAPSSSRSTEQHFEDFTGQFS
jgi:nucleoside-diphosphate-sugar epimerase